MIQVDNHGKTGYCLHGDSDPLDVQVGYGHYARNGVKDFVTRMTAYEPGDDGAIFEAATYLGSSARVKVNFVGECALRLRMVPEGSKTDCRREVLSLDPYNKVKVEEMDKYIRLSTKRLEVYIYKCPWQIVVYLDGSELTKEQIKDQDVGLKYKSIPLGFSRKEDGSVVDCFETMYMYSDENFYGFGEKFTDFGKRGQKITVWQRDAQSTNADVAYKAMPYFMSSMGYSILLNTFTRNHFNMGATSGVSYTMEAEDPYLDYYMFCDRDFKRLLKEYTSFSGRSPMIPKWAFGFWMSKMSYLTRQEVQDTVEHMEAFGMSADVIHIDGWLDFIGGGDGKELLAFDEKRFPDPEGMIQWLKDKGIHLSLWMFPYLPAYAKDENGKTILGKESKLVEVMRERNFIVKDYSGNPYVFPLGEGDIANTAIVALDFTNPEFVAYLKERVKRLMRMGVGVIKTDFSEEIPEDAVFYDGSRGLEGHNKYTYLYSKTVYEACAEGKAETGEKGLIWCRSGYAGSQKYPAHWAGDSSATENNLASILKGGLSLGLSGVSFWGFDIGGFYNSDDEGNIKIPEDHEYIRSVQMGLMAPLSRSHGQSPREPWNFSKKTQDAFLKINKLRYRMVPYFYSTAHETVMEGIPMMRAMLLEFQNDLNARNLSTQYMLGEAMLVAPVFDQQIQHIYLPKGSWIDLNSGKRKEAGWIVSDQVFDEIPLYLRENKMIPLLKEAPMHIGDQKFENLEIWMNLTDSISQNYYDDDITGSFQAVLKNDVVEITTKDMDVAAIKAWIPAQIRRCFVNGTQWSVRKADNAWIIDK